MTNKSVVINNDRAQIGTQIVGDHASVSQQSVGTSSSIEHGPPATAVAVEPESGVKRQARPSPDRFTVAIGGVGAFACIGLGGYALKVGVRGAVAFEGLGIKLTTGDVGFSLCVLGVLALVVTVRSALR